jgi:D-alanyl-D-alanine carboxypeptidase (penicillin-binding protein 5/6)
MSLVVTMFFYCIVCCFLAFSWQIVFASLPCEVSAPIAVLINADTGKVLFEKNGNAICFPASTTKLATALFALHKNTKGLQEPVEASKEALATVSSYLRRESGKHPSYRLEFGGTHMGIKVGEVLDMLTLLYGTMLPSGNDAANVVAEATSGSIATFMQELNDFLRSIGCEKTYFTNPHGLPDERHVTTALDLAKIAFHAEKHPVLKSVVAAKERQRPVTNKQQASKLIQTNALLKPGKFYYPYATGMKTGYTAQSGYNLIASAEKGDRKVIAVVCHCTELAQRYRSAVQLFEQAFNEVKQTRKLLLKEHDFFPIQLQGAKNRLDAILQEDIIVCSYPSEGKSFHYTVCWLQNDLPIAKGEEVGFIQIVDEENRLEKIVPLVAAKPVLATFSYQAKKKIDKIVFQVKPYRIWFGYSLGGLFLWGAFLHRKKIRRKLNKVL